MFKKRNNVNEAAASTPERELDNSSLDTKAMAKDLEKSGIESGHASAIVDALYLVYRKLCRMVDLRLGLQRNVLLVLGAPMLCGLLLQMFYLFSTASKLYDKFDKAEKSQHQFERSMSDKFDKVIQSVNDFKVKTLENQKEFEDRMIQNQQKFEDRIVVMIEKNSRDIVDIREDVSEIREDVGEIRGILRVRAESGEDGGLKKSSDKPESSRNGAGIGFPAPGPGARPFPWGCPWPLPQDPDGPFAGKPPGIGIGPGALAPRMRGGAPPPAVRPPFTGIRFDGALGGY